MKRLFRKIENTPIHYFSDLFIVIMVSTWIISLPIVCIVATYSTIFLQDNSLWSEFTNLVAIPLTAGGAIWMIKNSVQHAIRNKQDKECEYDFASVETEEIEFEKPFESEEE